MSSEHLKLVAAPGGGAASALIGKVLDGRYEIEKLLGEGGMGLVFKARHVTLGKPLAIKVLKAEVSKDGEIVQRFRQEAQSATAIGNHHIIDISDFGALPDGSTYFVMEYLDGISLTKAIEPGKPLPSPRSIHIAKQLCRALGAAHDAGIVHRDLKPDNIYLIARGGDRDFVKVLDFGIAKVGGGKSKLTQVGQVFGTPHYMSPEQCAGTVVDKRTDIYALGVIMYEMTSSRVPFDADNLMGILTKHLYEEPVKPHDLAPPADVPPALEAVLMKALAKKPEHRYQTMQEVLADLELVEQGLTPSAVVDGVRRAARSNDKRDSGRAPNTGAITVDMGTVDLPKNRALALAGLALLAAIGVGVWASTRGEHGAEARPEPGVAGAPAASAAATAPASQPATPITPAPAGRATPSASSAEATDAGAKQVEPAPAARITITSAPIGAKVWVGAKLVGNTPYELERPGSGQRTIWVKKAGYKDVTFPLTPSSDATITIVLERQTAAPSPPPAPRVEPAPAPPKPEPEKKVDEKKPRARPSTEVLDPWN